MQRSALVTGICGQDGRYLSRLLVNEGYTVYGLLRNTNKTLPSSIVPVYGDLNAPPDLPHVNEVYNLAAVTHVGESFKSVENVYQTNAVAAIKLMEWAAAIGAKFYQASTSEMFGNSGDDLQTEQTPMDPVSPYGVAKLVAHKHAGLLRKRGHFVSCGILFNHESPFRGHNFVTQKVVTAAREGRPVTLGNLDAYRDWGHAEDYVQAMYLMMQRNKPDDYVIATGESHSIRELLEIAYGPEWGRYVSTKDEYRRPLELHKLCGDSSKARNVLGWKPKKDFKRTIRDMIEFRDDAFWPGWMDAA